VVYFFVVTDAMWHAEHSGHRDGTYEKAYKGFRGMFKL